MAGAAPKKAVKKKGPKPAPLSKIKLADAMRSLLIDKDFQSITTAEISRTASANEALIYRYFGDKRGLLHYVLEGYMLEAHARISSELEAIKSVPALERLKKLIWISIDSYNSHRVFAKIIFIEVRNYAGYFESETYTLIRNYGQTLSDLLEEAKQNGEIREDTPVAATRNAIIGSIEHLCLPGVIFGKQFSPNILTEDLCKIIFSGITPRD